MFSAICFISPTLPHKWIAKRVFKSHSIYNIHKRGLRVRSCQVQCATPICIE
ncbi:DUF1196 domain-containing protein [Bacteroides salyersiae]|uniref:DUF1196 domain-containing protein n=1 Tax=Bacteroides salyersiae TaxID=291644 RepID=A0A7J4XIS8_9BACE|nr:DUF1196 domain-containing protein [Bacteroides salyersiae]KAA3696020.1 DUF1196 domain-containing protein [Bacteroides salyersiae]KAA3701998.1 DUF1196 domain-containing protein [Bacteroides salyersiae]KAA3704425.1 DUF1196 domain-containing protein [Bacteroides salyersiae]KAA3710838.1 DUF1196 domain-containing protein [Bacteroides salyersiae]